MISSGSSKSSKSKLIARKDSAKRQSKLSNSESSRRKNRLRETVWNANRDW